MPAIRPIAQTNVGSLCGSFGNRQGRNASSLMVTNSAPSASRSASAYSASRWQLDPCRFLDVSRPDARFHARRGPRGPHVRQTLLNAILFRKAAHSITILFKIELISPPTPGVRNSQKSGVGIGPDAKVREISL